MLFAHDYNDNRVHIDDTHSNKEYYCPYCGAPLVTRKGDIRQHHFAHKKNHLCSDTWEREHSYDISPWHNEWQDKFPKENQEIKLKLGQTTHRADVMIGKTVIEFQHSIMPAKFFDDRNNFYFNLGYKVIWLFDLSDLYENDKLTYEEHDNSLTFSWKNPKKAFNSYDVKCGCIDLFFQIFIRDKSCIVQVKDVSESGFEIFETSFLLDKSDFLEYVGLSQGVCIPPDRDDISTNEKYLRFKEEYNITLNKQQERALQSVEGSNLLLAVPGSGKTTVLVARIGYMIFVKGIDPKKILAITFNRNATIEMKRRFSDKFRNEIGNQIEFRTINSISNSIYKNYCNKNNRPIRTLIEGTSEEDLNLKTVLRKIYKKYNHDEYATDDDILLLETAFAYIKNMILSDEQIKELDDDIPNLSQMFAEYQLELKNSGLMDYNDQMTFAHWILSNDTESLASYRDKYKYICVDEAQDTSKIQHEIIHILAEANNLFMVGDEDQCIYGFRGAYPRALLNFRYDYRNPYILRMERNYRSTSQIVEKAQTFISQNKGRYEKNMTADRGDGEDVGLINVKTRAAQYDHLLDVAKNRKDETAFLYRDNDSAVALIDLFLRNDVPFRLRKPEKNFFGSKVVKDITAYLKLAVNCYDTNSFDQICNKGILYLKANPKKYAIINSVRKHISIYDALDEQMEYVKPSYRDRASDFRFFMKSLETLTTSQAIDRICKNGYENYVEKNNLGSGKIEVLQILARQESNIQSFLQRLKDLENIFVKGSNLSDVNPIVLSTIHSSKGLEYDTVYMVDVYDGRFPSSRPNLFSRAKDNANGEQEERRLFYVGITRAKNKLFLINIEDRYSSFIAELFPSEYHSQHSSDYSTAQFEHPFVRISPSQIIMPATQIRAEQPDYQKEFKRKLLEKQMLEEKRKREKEAAEKRKYEECYLEVCDKFTQQSHRITDHTGRRWIKCEICGQIKPDTEFVNYGGPNRNNSGLCSSCSRNKVNYSQ